VERTAYEILARVPEFVWDGETLPVPVEAIVEDAFGLQIRLTDDMHLAPGLEPESGRDVSGLLLTGLGEIWVNRAEAEQWQGRARFTVGHELGHFVLHRDRLGRTIFCRTVETPGDRTALAEADGQVEGIAAERASELEADAFAAALLMPRHLLEPAHRACRGDVETLMAEFGTSEKAMRYRIGHLFP